MKHPFYATALLLLISLSCCKKNGETIPVYDFTYTGTGYSYSAVIFSPVVPANATCYWQFGDGTTSTERSPAHVYKTEDTFLVSLIVNNDSRHLVSKKLTIQSTVKRMNGAYQTTTHAYRGLAHPWPIDHSLISYTTNWPLAEFDITTLNDTQLAFSSALYPYYRSAIFKSRDSLATDSTIVFTDAGRGGPPYLIYDHKNDNIFYDYIICATIDYSVSSFKLR